MILNSFVELEENKFPVVIFGSGPAGLSLALELEKKNISCLIIEAGDEFYNDESQSYFKINTEGTILKDISSSRLRQFGGTSASWGGWCKPFSDLDIKKTGLNPEEIKKHQSKTCEILGIKNLFRESSINKDFNQIEFQYSDTTFYEKYFSHIKASKKILLLLNTQLSHFEGKNKIVKKAICFLNGKKFDIKSREFILCCGGIENSRILLWTKFKNKDLLKNNLNIGNYWMTHYWILGGIGFIDLNNFKSFMRNNFLDREGAIHIASKENKLKNNLQMGLYLSTNEDQNFIKEMVKSILCISPEYGKKIARLVLNKSLKCGNIFMHIEEDPIYDNKIVLDENIKDPNQIPLAKIEYKSSLKSKKNAKSELEKLANLFKQRDLGRVALADEIYNLKEFENLGNYHHMGGTRIGDSIQDSVINKDFKVHDIDNLYVLGSSNFRFGTYKNPTFTIIQYSVKLANDLKEKLI
ncbi:GMC oxidoreductase [Candidatus Pelagibacter sp.]|nr:GMC oxidoreductase [Candidatus Pelagibacter sp.]